jgi:nitroreductase
MDVLAAMHQRSSVRNYRDRLIDPALLQRLLSLVPEADHVTEHPPRIELVSGVEQTQQVLTFMIGSYGLIQNAPHLLVGVLPEDNDAAHIDLGYVLEQVVLEATRLGLGTCWITGTFDAQNAGEVVGLATSETVGAVCALGHPTEEGLGRFHSRLVRRLAGGHKRKPLTEIVFDERWGRSWSPENADQTLVTILEHARLAPSAHNAQPWRFVVRPSELMLATVKPAPIDAGIIMSHVKLAAEALDFAGDWTLLRQPEAFSQDYELPRKAVPVAIWA